NGQRAENIARARELLAPAIIPVDAIKAISPNAAEPQTTNLCPCCDGRMIIIERFERGAAQRCLAHRERVPPQVLAIELDQVEGIEEHACVMAPVPNPVK